MPPKKKRADKKTIEKIFKKGGFISSHVLGFKFIFSKNSKDSRISFLVPKSLVKLAVKRNKLRRMGYTALKKNASQLPLGVEGVIIFKKPEDNISILEDEIKTIFNKIN